MRTYQNVAWGLTLLVAIHGILVGNTDIPAWTIAITSVICGFWWAFGKGVVGVDASEGRDRQRNRNR
jgi:hypothetical protein